MFNKKNKFSVLRCNLTESIYIFIHSANQLFTFIACKRKYITMDFNAVLKQFIYKLVLIDLFVLKQRTITVNIHPVFPV